jgi:hypothetical protein
VYNKLPLNNILSQLINGKPTLIHLDDFDIYLSMDKNSILTLKTPVYQGACYIPKGVRQCVKRVNSANPPLLKTSLIVEQETFQVLLNLCSYSVLLNMEEIKLLLKEFIDLATMWRVRLDERDRQDHIYISVK